MVAGLATRLFGSSDLYQYGREPGHGINFVTSHDGFTLYDLVSYNEKHNSGNGEENRDGDNNNLSWNCGVEGPTGDPEISALRERQVRNFAALLLLSRGVPMLLAGDEMGRSQNGNNNAYCQDNAGSWLNWEQLESKRSLQRFFRLLIAFRKAYELLRYDSFVVKNGYGPEISWHGIRLGQPDWSGGSRCLAMHISGSTPKGRDRDMFLIANAAGEAKEFELPRLGHQCWQRFIDTDRPGDEAITELENMQPVDEPYRYRAGSRSVVVLIAECAG
jgi:glycogen operon protein